ncbi:hypothetical protein MHYP_G00310090 [Metynnis hypsauchen]
MVWWCSGDTVPRHSLGSRNQLRKACLLTQSASDSEFDSDSEFEPSTFHEQKLIQQFSWSWCRLGTLTSWKSMKWWCWEFQVE